VVEVIWHKTASPPQTVQPYLPGGAKVPTGEVLLAPPGEYDWTCASFSTPESTAQMANRSVQPFLLSSRQKVPVLYNGGPFPPNCPFSWGGSGPPSISWFLEADRAHSPNCITIITAIFAQVIAECPYTLQWDAPFRPQNCSFPWGNLDPHLIRGSLGPPESSTQMASWSVQPF